MSLNPGKTAITVDEWKAMQSNGRKSKRTKRAPEAAVQRAVLEYLQYHPAVAKAWRNNAGKIKTESGGLVNMSPAGTSDIIGFMKDGRFLAVEVKAGKNQPTDLQQEFIDDETLTAVRQRYAAALIDRSAEKINL